jgi:hypothetical protein
MRPSTPTSPSFLSTNRQNGQRCLLHARRQLLYCLLPSPLPGPTNCHFAQDDASPFINADKINPKELSCAARFSTASYAAKVLHSFLPTNIFAPAPQCRLLRKTPTAILRLQDHAPPFHADKINPGEVLPYGVEVPHSLLLPTGFFQSPKLFAVLLIPPSLLSPSPPAT